MTHTLDSYGGTTQLKGKSTGWFHLEELGGRRWFITPEGNAFFPVSLSHIYTGNSQPTVQKLYDGDEDAWIEKWFGQMRALGFNCALAGATSQCRDPEGYVDVERVEALFRRESFPYAAGLFLIPHPNELPKGQERPDIFASAYQEWVEALVADVCSRYADDPMMMGYYYGSVLSSDRGAGSTQYRRSTAKCQSRRISAKWRFTCTAWSTMRYVGITPTT